MKPEEIENLSFQIIETETGPHQFPPDQWTIVRRVIHTSADFDYLRNRAISSRGHYKRNHGNSQRLHHRH